jgi:hypothetical protein
LVCITHTFLWVGEPCGRRTFFRVPATWHSIAVERGMVRRVREHDWTSERT